MERPAALALGGKIGQLRVIRPQAILRRAQNGSRCLEVVRNKHYRSSWTRQHGSDDLISGIVLGIRAILAKLVDY